MLSPLPPAAARALPVDRATASRVLGAELSGEWPGRDVFDVLPLQEEAGQFRVWVMIERDTSTVVGDIGFVGGPGEDGVVEIGFSVVPSRRRRGYASEAVGELVSWASMQPGVRTVVARCRADNAGSIGTLERAGFVRTQVTGDEIEWRFA